jgi:hypothetical protein
MVEVCETKRNQTFCQYSRWMLNAQCLVVCYTQVIQAVLCSTRSSCVSDCGLLTQCAMQCSDVQCSATTFCGCAFVVLCGLSNCPWSNEERWNVSVLNLDLALYTYIK